MRALAVVLALLAAPAWAQMQNEGLGQTITDSGLPGAAGIPAWVAPDFGGQVVLMAYLNATGPLLPEDSGTVSHVYWDGSALVDTVTANTWSMQGTVPQVAENVGPFVPGKAGAGTYTDANYYSGGTSIMEWGATADWSVTAVFKPSAITGAQVLVSKGTNASGWILYINSSGYAVCTIYDGGIKNATTSNTVVLNGINVASCGRSGGYIYSRLNGSAVSAGTAVSNMTSGSATAAMIGRFGTAGSSAVSQVIYEIIASTTAYSDALHEDRWRRVFGLYTGQGGVISVSRGTTSVESQNYGANGLFWYAPWGPANYSVAPISTDGMEVWKSSTNYGLNSEDLTTGWLQTGTCAVNTNQGPAGFTDLDLVTCTGVNDTRYRTNISGPTAALMTACVWAAADTGSKVASILGNSNSVNATSVSCYRYDGGSCTAFGNGTAFPGAYTTVDTTPVRFCVTWQVGSAQTLHSVRVHDGQYGSTSNIGVLFGRASIETGSYSTPYIPTGATAVARSATLVSTPLPSLGTKFCASFTAKPGGGRAWGSLAGYILGNYAASTNGNWGVIENIGGGLSFYSFDSTDTLHTSAIDYVTLAWSAGSSHRITACLENGTTKLYTDGVLRDSDVAAGLRTAEVSPLNIGVGVGIVFDGTISNIKICKGATRYSQCP